MYYRYANHSSAIYTIQEENTLQVERAKPHSYSPQQFTFCTYHKRGKYNQNPLELFSFGKCKF